MSRMKLINAVAVCVFLSSLASAQSGGLRFNVTDLNRFLKDVKIKSSVAYAINDRGQVVGSFMSDNEQYCFYYTGGQTAPYFGSAAPSYCDARAVNSKGYIAG